MFSSEPAVCGPENIEKGREGLAIALGKKRQTFLQAITLRGLHASDQQQPQAAQAAQQAAATGPTAAARVGRAMSAKAPFSMFFIGYLHSSIRSPIDRVQNV